MGKRTKQLRREVADLRDGLDQLRKELATEIQTKRIVVDAGQGSHVEIEPSHVTVALGDAGITASLSCSDLDGGTAEVMAAAGDDTIVTMVAAARDGDWPDAVGAAAYLSAVTPDRRWTEVRAGRVFVDDDVELPAPEPAH